MPFRQWRSLSAHHRLALLTVTALLQLTSRGSNTSPCAARSPLLSQCTGSQSWTVGLLFHNTEVLIKGLCFVFVAVAFLHMTNLPLPCSYAQKDKASLGGVRRGRTGPPNYLPMESDLQNTSLGKLQPQAWGFMTVNGTTTSVRIFFPLCCRKVCYLCYICQHAFGSHPSQASGCPAEIMAQSALPPPATQRWSSAFSLCAHRPQLLH